MPGNAPLHPVRRRLAFWALLALALWPALAQDAAEAPGTPVPAPATEPASALSPSSAPTPEPASAPTPEPAAAPTPEDLIQATLAIDIASSDYAALLDRCRELGLGLDGGEEALRARLYAHYGLEPPALPETAGVTVRVLSADRARYGDLEGESVVILEGGVSLELSAEDGGLHRLFADRVVYNRAIGSISARGNVTYRTEGPGGGEAFSGTALSLDLGSWDGRFLGGRTLREAAIGGAQGLFFEADEIVRSGSDAATFRGGLITSCDLEEDPHWSIRASKVWLLAPGEWALANATLSVGEVPLLWIPFFYYPGEELVFHPVFGYDERLGRFVQTSTYLLGRKPPAKDESLPFSLAGEGGDMEKERRGLFLRSTGRALESPSPDYAKVLADIYGNLGAALGLDLKLGSLPLGGSLQGGLLLARSRSLFARGDGTYTPLDEDYDWRSVWNDSTLFGAEIPLRFSFDLDARFQAGGAALSIRLPFATDAWVDRDFRKRSEDMDWLSFLDQQASADPPAKRVSLLDSLEFSWTPRLEGLSPWLQSASLTRLSSSLSWSARTRTILYPGETAELLAADPGRDFFIPDRLLIADTQASLRGTLFSFKPSAAAPTMPAPEGPALREPEALRDGAPEPSEGAGEGTGARGFVPPPSAPEPPRKPEARPHAELTWSLSPALSLERRFATIGVDTPEDIDFDPWFDLAVGRASAQLGLALGLPSGFLDASLGLQSSVQGQERSTISSDASAAELVAWRLQDARFASAKTSASIKLSNRPFAADGPLGGLVATDLPRALSLSWTMDALLWSRVFESADVDGQNPIYADSTLAWDRDSISTHQASLSFAPEVLGYAQTATLGASLPPLREAYSGRVDLSAPATALSASTKYAAIDDSGTMRWDPLSAQLSFSPLSFVKAQGSFVWNIEEDRPESAKAGATLGPLTSSLSFRRSPAYELIPASGWSLVADSDAFRATDFSLGLSGAWKPDPVWRRRISGSLSADLRVNQNLLRFTESSLSFELKADFLVSEAFSLSVASSSRNLSLWRYFPGLFDFPAGVEPVDPLRDLLDSFDFFSPGQVGRHTSLWKLNALSVKAKRSLHDWDVSLELSAKPVLDPVAKEYTFESSWTFLVAWRAIPKFATKASGTGAEFALE